jgi:hypothetical protein
LFRDGVLVGENGAGSVAGVDRVNGWDDGEEVLEFVEVVGCTGDGAIERVDEGWVEGSKGELGNYVREVEGCSSVS